MNAKYADIVAAARVKPQRFHRVETLLALRVLRGPNAELRTDFGWFRSPEWQRRVYTCQQADITRWGYVSMIEQQEVARAWASRGFGCALWVDPPGQRWEDFVHATDELVLVVEGDLEFEIDGERHHPGVGEELFIPAGALHSVRNVGGTTARWLYGYRRS